MFWKIVQQGAVKIIYVLGDVASQGAAKRLMLSLCLRNGIIGESFLWRFNMRRVLNLCLFCRIWYLVFLNDVLKEGIGIFW